MMKKTILSLAATCVALSASAQPSATFSTDKFDGFTLHTYAGFDPMADVSFIVEGPNKLVIVEPQAFKGKVEEFVSYTEELGKPIEKVLVSFHAAGLKVYKDEHKVISKPMAQFMKSEQAQGMLGFFDQAFGGAMDTEIVVFDEEIEASAQFIVDGIEFQFEPTSVPGMPGVNIQIGEEVYYQHFSPTKGHHASKNQIKSLEAIDGALKDAFKAKTADYTLLLGSHGFGKSTREDLKFQIKYLKAMKKAASKAESAGNFIQIMHEKFPDCQGEEDLKGIAEKLF